MPRVRQGPLPDPIDVHIGGRLRALRRNADLTQEALAHEVGVAFQQLQKYERGANRISAARLYLLAKAVGRPVSEFYEGLPPTHADGSTADPVRADLDRLLGRRNGQALLKGLLDVSDAQLSLLLELVAALRECRASERSDLDLVSAA